MDEGNLVGAGERTLLTTIVKDDPIYVYFTASERDLLNYLEMYPERRTSTIPEGNPVFMGLANEKGFPHEGVTNWAENRVDPDTGTIRVRGVFDNEKHMVLPGMFVRIRVPSSIIDHALLVPETCVGADMTGHYVYVVDEKNVVEKRKIETGTLVDRMRVVEEGLAADEWVVVKGLQRAREGVTVNAIKEGEPSSPPSGVDPTRTDTTEDSSAGHES